MADQTAISDKASGLDLERLQAELSALPIEQLEVFEQIDSTNSYLLSKPVKRNCARICFAEAQTAGRGRRGNVWQSAPGSNIMMSMSWGFQSWPTQMSALSLAIGIGVAQTLVELYGVDAKIKWPNDILVDGKKLAGILIESTGNESAGCVAVIGLGLNVHQPDWPIQSDYPWVDLHTLGVEVDRNQLATELCRALLMVCRAFSLSGFTPMASAWNQLAAYKGKKVVLSNPQHEIQGRLCGVDTQGALLVEDGAVTHEITNSDYSLRLA